MSKQVVIVGGGLAGLATAIGLARADAQVTLLESRPRLGGRAGSFLDQETGEWIDTCQHVAMGCCTNLRHFARLAGIEDLFATQDELLFIGPQGERCRFADAPLPAPLHLLGAFLKLTYFSVSERLRLCRDVGKLAHRRWSVNSDRSFADWLSQHSTTADLRDRFWDVILISALSETAERISVPHARQVFVDGFLAHRDGWKVQIPTVSLDELYGRRLTDWLSGQGVTVRTQAGVASLEMCNGRVAAARMRTGEVIDADEFVVAVPWHRAGALLPPDVTEHEGFAGVKQLESAPITSLHLWFDRPVIDVPHAVLVGKLSQWVFRRIGDHIDRETDDTAMGTAAASRGVESSNMNANPDYLQVVISASRNVSDRSQTALIAEVLDELASIWPQVRVAQLTSSRVVTEHRAVFSPLPGVDNLRPGQQTPITNLQIAGDWTTTGWPATMEGAVKSGFLAAENLLSRLGQPQSLVQPSLPPSLLSRWLLRIDR